MPTLLHPNRQRGRVERRFFTLDEANAFIPRLEAWLTEMRRLKRRMDELGPAMTPVIERAYLNSGGHVASEFVRVLHQFNTLSVRLDDEGIILRDVEIGLVDFPALRFEREIHLCWKSGEPEITHWHEVDAGFANRRRLDELTEADVKTPEKE